jgi:ribose-phosphate pyrophosphokinase
MKVPIPGTDISNIFHVSRFPCGEVNVYTYHDKMPPQKIPVFFVEHSMDIMVIAQKMDILQNAGIYDISIVLPYLPYSRQDRYTAEGYSFALDVFSMHLNAMGFFGIYTVDVHSTAAFNCIPGLRNISTFSVIDKIIGEMSGPVLLIAPDEGAAKKVETYSRESRFKRCIQDVIFATKVRDPNTGNITDTRVPLIDPATENILIIDDICDGGRTFTEIASRLPTWAHTELFVTHGRFSKEDAFVAFDKVHSTNTIDCLHTAPNHTIHPINFLGDDDVITTS